MPQMSATALAHRIAVAIMRDGGSLPVSVLPVRQTWLRKGLGDRRLLPFLQEHPDLFQVTCENASGEKKDMVWTVQVDCDTVKDLPITAEDAAVDARAAAVAKQCILQWTVWTLRAKEQLDAVPLPWLTANQKITKRIHAYTRVLGTCEGAPAFTAEWWDAASAAYLDILEESPGIVEVLRDTGDVRKATVRLRSLEPLASDPGLATEDAKLVKRIAYLLTIDKRQSRKGAPVAAAEGIPAEAIPIAKLGGDLEVQKHLQGRPLRLVLEGLRDVVLTQHGEAWLVGLAAGAAPPSLDRKAPTATGPVAKQAPRYPPPRAPVVVDGLPHYVVVAKPAGRTTEDVAGQVQRENNAEAEVDTVSRLDRQTSGALVIPLTKHAEAHLGDQFREGSVAKRYVALVSGEAPEAGEVDARLKLVDAQGSSKSYVHHEGKPARTLFTRTALVTRPGTGGVYSLLSVAPQTGRTHQIRAHMAHLGHPLVCDKKYAGEKRSKRHAKWCPRLFLHAEELVFRSPLAPHEEVRAVVPLAEDLQAVVDTLRPTTRPDAPGAAAAAAAESPGPQN